MATEIEELIHSLKLDALLDDRSFDFDLRQGVIYNQAKTRLCLFSADLLGGVHKALLDEAGEAWPFIFKRCGQTWGARLARRLDREFQLLQQKALGDLILSDFLQVVRLYFAGHGWGVLEIQVEQAQQNGVVEASLRESIFAEVIPAGEEMVDSMMAGILASLIGHLAGRELDCVQTVCSSSGAPVSRFVITAPERLTEASAKIRSGISHEDLVAAL